MSNTPVTTGEAIAAVDAAVSSAQESALNAADTIIESVVEHAVQRVEEAEELAQRVTDAAMQTEIGRQVTAIREEFDNWRSQIMTELSSFRETISMQIAEIREAPPIVALLTPQQTEQSSSIPEASDSLEAMAEAVIPGSVSEAAPVVLATPAPEPAPVRKVRRLI